ncbi:MerR family DNA-binding protein [Rubritepida flocculans]|jgi:Cu(I)-responsive transcriptional regulator|uniref:MerR family DNA-binding protein n=1 Tax=Rubritepida flocculans TaxID=182403 RepID=UPI0003FB8012|nr:MerR family DNA-binding protein [Rubritepida flocculans]
MKVGEVARAVGVSSKAIRTWEAAGLVPGAARGPSGYRAYTAADLATLRFVAQARRLGFGMERIRGLLALWQDRGRSSAEVKRLALAQATLLREEAAALTRMADELERLAAHCHGDARPDCPILDALARPADHA